ncbi:Low-density lipoprotein receptor-related protein 8 [Holothuria leucospilota]|uniref:Low-density lipoprotein receptor-related protein 8 n=1 Tax=Holothuria leucospilota TaxID=206669 RepID=A0A9Q1CR73_HOLLE|nr:Low-density lipoprotein receptor-related protein 8 [Holothuria leucospilota]
MAAMGSFNRGKHDTRVRPESETCTGSEFACADNSACISSRWVCDGEVHCNDNSDEENCETPTCAPNYFQCAHTHYCIPQLWTCDGDYDCVNGSDEADCETQNVFFSLCGEGLFQCKNGDCIHPFWKCDQQNDCGDNSDEDISICPAFTCPPHLITCQDGSCAYGLLCDAADQTCSLNQFTCSDGTCIDQNRYCDGFADCVHGEDEPVNQNCGLCPTGFTFNWETTKCDDIDECNEIWGACSQICLNHNGTYTCKCKDGFQLINNTFCDAKGPSAAVFFVYHHTIRKFNLSNHKHVNLFTGLSHPNALALDVNDGIVFWSDVQERKIMMGFLNGQLDVRVAVQGTGIVDGIGYDWVHKNLFWTDALNNTINVASREGDHHKSLITEHLDEPRAIAVAPRTGWGRTGCTYTTGPEVPGSRVGVLLQVDKGAIPALEKVIEQTGCYMFWSEWGTNPKIERAGMNGAYRQTIIDSNKMNIQWPNGLTIDYPSDMLYWVEARHHLLATCDFNGDNYRVILRDESTLMHPFHITVFEDNVYWTDWNAFSIQRVNKFTGKDLTDVVGRLVRGTPAGLYIWHSSQQPKACYDRSFMDFASTMQMVEQSGTGIQLSCPSVDTPLCPWYFALKKGKGLTL